MKANIGPHKKWFGPYQLAETLCFWVKPQKDEYGIPTRPEWVTDFGEWLAYGSVRPEPEVGDSWSIADDRKPTWIHRFLIWIHSFQKRNVQVRIDPWDTWGADDTLAHIILPLLKQLNENKHGAPFVDDEDVPEELRSTSAPPKENEWDTDENHFKRWDWVLGEMIFAFKTKVGDLKDWEDQFHTGESDIIWVKEEGGTYRMDRGENDTHQYDIEGAKAYQERISNGFRLFGKYYESLWS